MDPVWQVYQAIAFSSYPSQGPGYTGGGGGMGGGGMGGGTGAMLAAGGAGLLGGLVLLGRSLFAKHPCLALQVLQIKVC